MKNVLLWVCLITRNKYFSLIYKLKIILKSFSLAKSSQLNFVVRKSSTFEYFQSLFWHFMFKRNNFMVSMLCFIIWHNFYLSFEVIVFYFLKNDFQNETEFNFVARKSSHLETFPAVLWYSEYNKQVFVVPIICFIIWKQFYLSFEDIVFIFFKKKTFSNLQNSILLHANHLFWDTFKL